MTFLELAQRLRQEVGASGAGPAAVTGQSGESKRLVDWVRDAWLEIQSRHTHWQFLWGEFEKPTTSEQRDYTVADDVREIVRNTVRLDGQRLFHLDYGVYQAHANAEQLVTGSFTLLPNGKLRLIPPREGTLIGEYYRSPQVLTEPDDKPLAPAHLHDTIIALAMTYYGRFEDAPEIYQDGQAMFRRWITRMQNECLPDIQMPGPLV